MRFEAERERLAPLLGAAAIHHIGSTAVPGLAAKPIVDLMALVEDLDAPIEALTERAGYQFPEAFNAQLAGRRWLCRPSARHRTHHLHLVGERAELDRHLRFRDRLRESPALAAEYVALKRRLAIGHQGDREAYTAAKAAFVERLDTGRHSKGATKMRPQPLIAVRDVEASSRWYQRLLSCESAHGGPEYERLVFDGELILQLHDWDREEHPHLGDPDAKPYGNGVLLWFQTDEFDAAIARAHELGAEIVEGPRVNPNARHRECWIRDPDGYVVVLAGAPGDLGVSA